MLQSLAGSPEPQSFFKLRYCCLVDVTGDVEHMGQFRTPSLRNVEKAPPYMHDGSVQAFDNVLEIYNRGGMILHSGPAKGGGAVSPF